MIYSIFKNKVERFPNQVAFVLENGKSLTYAQADTLISKIADVLYHKGVRPGHRVGFISQLESEHPFVFYALNKLNATYVPFDKSIPAKQLELDKEKLKLHHFFQKGEINIKGEEEHPAAPEIEYNDQIPAYIVSSSGTSGDKKWIPIRGAGLEYWEEAEQALFHFKVGHRVLCTRSPGYDARISEYLRALISGGTLYMISNHERKDLNYIVDYCEKNKIQTILMIASQLQGEDLEAMIARLAKAGLQNLIVTGDACSPRLKDLCVKYKIKLINAYGPTEACFGVSLIEANQLTLVNAQGNPVVPIGFPYGDQVKLHLIEGKLYIESPYLSDGYFEDPEKTKELFSDKIIEGRNVRVFDTGDLFEIQNNLLLYKGRDGTSEDVKISGVKTNLKSMNNLAKACPGIDQICVVNKPINGINTLFVYFTVDPGFDNQVFINHLKSWISPDIAPVLIKLKAFPLKEISSKIDSSALINRVDDPSEYFSFSDSDGLPNDPLMNSLVEIWSDLLNHKPTSLDADFRFSGGDSNAAKRLVGRIQKTLDPSFAYKDLMVMEVVSLGAIYNRVKNKPNNNEQSDHAHHTLFTRSNSEEDGIMFVLPPLLGDATAVQKLANNFHAQHPKTIYGLTDPSLYGDATTPSSMNEAVERYVKAILQIQPHVPVPSTFCQNLLVYRRYNLMGYSYGSILAYRVAAKLRMMGCAVEELHLVDGFSPLFYLKITRSQNAILLQEFAGFIVTILNNEFYNEEIRNASFNTPETVSKEIQINSLLDSLSSMVKNPLSKNMLKLVRAHLLFLLEATPHVRASPRMTRLYLSKPGQNYISLIDGIPGLIAGSFDYNYYYWNRYFSNIQRCELIANSDHLSLITNTEVSKPYFMYKTGELLTLPSMYSHTIRDFKTFYIMNSDDCTLMATSQTNSQALRLSKHLKDTSFCHGIEVIKQSFKYIKIKETHDRYHEEQYMVLARFPKNRQGELHEYLLKFHEGTVFNWSAKKLGVKYSIDCALEGISTDFTCTSRLNLVFKLDYREPIEFHYASVTISTGLLRSLMSLNVSQWFSIKQENNCLILDITIPYSSWGWAETNDSCMSSLLPVIMPYRLDAYRKALHSSSQIDQNLEAEKLSEILALFNETKPVKNSKCSIM